MKAFDAILQGLQNDEQSAELLHQAQAKLERNQTEAELQHSEALAALEIRERNQQIAYEQRQAETEIAHKEAWAALEARQRDWQNELEREMGVEFGTETLAKIDEMYAFCKTLAQQNPDLDFIERKLEKQVRKFAPKDTWEEISDMVLQNSQNRLQTEVTHKKEFLELQTFAENQQIELEKNKMEAELRYKKHLVALKNFECEMQTRIERQIAQQMPSLKDEIERGLQELESLEKQFA